MTITEHCQQFAIQLGVIELDQALNHIAPVRRCFIEHAMNHVLDI
ncbi:hypothetical protein [Actinokineospora xionganensis]|nr:hypothetical protein [Actinokineospora xionganensis]